MSFYEILECLRVHGRLSTSKMAMILERNLRSLSTELSKLAFEGFVRKVGIEKGKTKYSTVWELGNKAWNILKVKGIKSFYEIPQAKYAEEIRIKFFGKPFKRFF